MNRKELEKQRALLSELERLEKVNKLTRLRMFDSDSQSALHFELRKHYGHCEDYEIVLIDKRYTERLMAVVDEIIKELKVELGISEDEG